MAASLVPLLLFAILQVGFAAREQRRAIETRAINRADKLILAADTETVRYAILLDALATSQVMRERQWPLIAQRFAAFEVSNPDVRGLTIRNQRGEVLVSLGLSIQGARAVADGMPGSIPIFTGYVRTGSCLCLIFERAAVTDSGERVVVAMLADSKTFNRLLPPTEEYPVVALVGPKARFIARSVGMTERFGTMSSEFLQQAVASGRMDGIYRGRTLEGFENYTAFARSKRTGWSAHVALGSDYIDNPARQFLGSLIMAAMLSLLLAGLLVAFAIRQMREARRLAERMQQTQKMEALGQLTGGLAHDFNNLLTPVIGTLDQLTRREGLDERGRKLAAGALTSAQRAAKLTQQLLAFSRRQRLTVGAVVVADLLSGVAQLVERTVSNRHQFRIESDPEVRCVRSDLTQLELALLNLAINARDALPDGGEILLRVTREEPDLIRFAMIDHGTGMDEQTLRRALEPFFTTKPTGRGTGLGLAQVFGVVEQSGGTVEIDSAPGEGTTVSLLLPACTEEEGRSGRAGAAGAAEPSARPLRVLVVDDEDEVRATLSQMLSEAGHKVCSVSNGRSALASIESEEFDLVVTDYLMPEMSGAELIAAAQERKPGLAFLVVSGFADSDELSRSCPNSALVAKPFTAAELLAAVDRAVQR